MHRLLEGKDTHFQRMVLSVETYKRSKINSKEILLDGEMYDIKSLSFSGGDVELLVIHDKHEGGVLKKMQLLLKNGSEQNSKVPTYLIKLISLFYLNSFIEFCFDDLVYSSIIFNSGPELFTSFSSEISSPPPEC